MKQRSMFFGLARTSFLVAMCSTVSVWPSVVQAQTPPPAAANPKNDEAQAPPADDPQARAAARKKAGDEAMEAFRFADALAAYSDAYAVTNNVALLYNMGRALEALNRFPEALEKLSAFDAAAPKDLKARVPHLPQLIADLRKRVATLVIRTNVGGARIAVRDVVVGKSPLTGPLSLLAGPADIEIDAEGYFPAKKTLYLTGGAEQTLDLELFSRATSGVLIVKASAKGAEVFVDDKRMGLAPVEVTVVQGTHRISVRHPEFRVLDTTAVVPAGESKTVTATLQGKSVATKWWFWTGVGAVVAGGMAVTIAAMSERDPDSGTIAPGVIATETFGVSSPVLFRF